MPNNEIEYLQEMGIDYYQLVYPERLEGYQSSKLVLPTSCKLLLISPYCPKYKTALLFKRVLSSIDLDLKQALHIYPEQFNQLSQPFNGWVWFAGCDKQANVNGNVLSTPLLSQIDGNNEQRRALWQQICIYK